MTLKTLLGNMLRRKPVDNLKTVSVAEFSALKDANDCVVIDVRSEAEFSERHVLGARLFPLDRLDAPQILALDPAGEAPIYVLCKAGGRAKKAAERLAPITDRMICVVAGGTDACIEAGIKSNSK